MSACQETARRVESWLAKRGSEGWVKAGGVARLMLCEQWRAVAREYGSASPAAFGCLLALVREAYNEPTLYVCRIDCTPSHSTRPVCWRWTVISPSADGSVCGLFELEAEALVAALEAAP